MPISPVYEWEQTEVALEVRVALPGTSRSKSDVFATDCMIKVNSSPYLLLLDLWGDVDDARSAATLTADGVKFKLYKRDPGLWPQLEWECTDKAAATARRNASIERSHARLAEAQKARVEAKAKEEKAAVDRQIEAERAKRAELERAKGAELASERADLEAWQAGIKGGKVQVQQGDESDYESDGEGAGAVVDDGADGAGTPGSAQMPDHPHYYGKGWRASDGQEPGRVSGSRHRPIGGKAVPGRSSDLLSLEDGQEQQEEEDVDVDTGKAERTSGGVSATSSSAGASATAAAAAKAAARAREESWVPLPPPRITLQPVKVEFTALELPGLPAREQREEELREYKKSVAKDKALLEDSHDVGDRQPAFLKDKGDALYSQGNYQGAIAAYSRAIQLDDSAPPLWSNRSAAHLKLGAWASAEEDACRALELLRARERRFGAGGDASAEDAAKWRTALVRALVRRAQACVGQGRSTEALADYEEAARYDQGRTAALALDIEELRASLVPADAVTLRQRGNARFAAGDAAGAEAAFSTLLGLPRGTVPEAERVAALSNRAAARLMMGLLPGAGEDCGDGLALAVGGLVAHCAALLGVELGPLLTTDRIHSHTAKAAELSLSEDTAAPGDQGALHEGTQVATVEAAPAAGGQVGTKSWLVGLAAAAVALAAATSGPTRGAALAWSAADSALCGWAAAGSMSATGASDVPSSATAAALLQELEPLEASWGSGSGMSGQADGASAASGSVTAQVQGARARLLSVCRLLARRGAVRGHAKEYSFGARDYRSAVALFAALGEPGARIDALMADAGRLEGMAQEQQQGFGVKAIAAGSHRAGVAGDEGQILDEGTAGGKSDGAGAGADATGGVLGEDEVDD